MPLRARERLVVAEGASKLEILGLWGVALPLPERHEACIDRSGEPTSTLCNSGAGFDRLWGGSSRLPIRTNSLATPYVRRS